jgi:hypothetical protein
LIICAIAWWWAMSVFTPWAPSIAPRLLLFDALYYGWFVLLAWALVEAAIAWRRWRERGERAYAWCLALLAVVGIAWIYERTDMGLQAKVRFSDAALRRSASLPYETPRHRAGHFLIDTVREPIAGQPWLWLGRPYGGGTGTQRALVLVRGSGMEGSQAPLHPSGGGTYAFRHLAGEWWLAEMR